ncbi:hypothetical protein B296_00042806 [Ensete ventricosum]|uniref:Uncharacterized protein n=1 Tax=Ensete ventricosum TaxID=4639 RepID=A0A426X2R5_ENSVE|nr:hypothetical protein B296_00042806 [Ensete ventricosum]
MSHRKDDGRGGKKGCSNLASFFAESAYDNAALSSVCAQGRDGSGHATDDPSRMLGRSRVGGSRIKWRPHAGLPQVADRSRGGSNRAGKQPPRVAEATQAAASDANSGSPHMPVAASQQSAARRTHALAVTLVAAQATRR